MKTGSPTHSYFAMPNMLSMITKTTHASKSQPATTKRRFEMCAK